SPIGHLKTPATFSYYQRQTAPETPLSAHPDHELFWRDGILIINRSYIGPRKEQAEILLPLLARMLYDYNTPNRLVEHLFHLAHVAEHSCLATVFLAIPLIAAQRCERQWQRLERERVLERDWFAYACGQGPGLRKQVRLQLQERTDNDLPDNTIPTLAERIDHLDSLLGREERQVERLREMLSAPPAFPPTQSVG
ncbi:MAG TPA: hypothetical protein VKX46_08830, partial [Ktedonobacteraceae bacterium]|nr:hypothetical protein [Ktedonobacteraceae bacterium]